MERNKRDVPKVKRNSMKIEIRMNRQGKVERKERSEQKTFIEKNGTVNLKRKTSWNRRYTLDRRLESKKIGESSDPKHLFICIGVAHELG